MKIYFSNTGCILEAEDFFRFLRLTGGEETKNFDEADVIIAHFCAMSTESFENIPPHMAIFQGLKKYGSPTPKLYIGGCATEVVDLKKRYPFVDGVFRKRKMIEDLSKYFGYDPKLDENLPINYYECVRIQTGCIRNCGFCKKGYLNMPLNSKTPDKVIADVKSAVSAGFHNIILLAENSTEYGIDLAVNVRLLDLLKSIVLIDEVTSLNVCGLCMDELALNPELVSFLRDCEKIHQLQIEIQSLIPEVRKNMGLSSSVEEVLKILKLLEKKYIITNIMLGYPGETDSGFDKQLKLMEEHGLYYAQVNTYDDTPCVPAHNLEQIPKEIVAKRMLIFLETLKRIREKLSHQIIAESKKNPIECIYTATGNFEMIGYSAIVKAPTNIKYSNGEKIKFRITNVQDLISPSDPNQSLVLKGSRV